MTGEVGTGKTTLLKSVLSSFTDRRISTAFVFNPRLDTLDFLEFVLADFGIPSNPRGNSGMPQTKSGMLMQLNRWLIDRFRNGELCAIVVDEAQNLSWELLEEIRLLTNLETSSRSWCKLCSQVSQNSRRNCVTRPFANCGSVSLFGAGLGL